STGGTSFLNGSLRITPQTTGGATTSFIRDPQGNLVSMRTSTGASFYYAGGYKDTSTGYTKFGARYYNPTRGRFTQPDPSAQEPNRYIYAGGNPINAVDPAGLDFIPSAGAAAAAIAGLAIATVGTASICLLTAIAGCLTGAAAFGAFAGAVGAGATAASFGANNDQAGEATAWGALVGAAGRLFTQL
ncbi:MAG TPA: RHS repeat-associated core domain-containing protein, partial [Paenarthrobacter sp.]|nr:RHS repeat-associated core domain-containing protein [Paenarthrobacter sp.]